VGVTVSVSGIGLVFAEVVGWDKTRDIALLEYSSNGREFPAPLARGPVLVGGEYQLPGLLGAPIAVLGYVPDITETAPIATFGHVGNRWNIIPGDVTTLQFDAAVTEGMSGGAVVDTNGLVIGMLKSRWKDFAGNARALEWQEIMEALPELRAGAKNP
jgi:S1-C subfamily serine protease